MTRKAFGVLTLLAIGAACGIWATDLPSRALAQNDGAELTPVTPVPVEESVHEYMEYMHQPVYRELKPVMAQPPTGDEDWTTIKSSALILAESGNLLLFRGPQENREAWVKHSVALRESGGEFYRAAKEKDFETARKHYETMIANCNACHDDFHNGKPNLAP